MALTKFTTNMDIIAALDNEPNDIGGLSATQLKATFDESGNAIKAYINETLTVEADETFATKAEVQAVVLGQIPDGTVTETKLESALATKINGAAQADDLIDTAINLSDAVKTALALTGTKYVSDALAKLSGAALRSTTGGNKLVDMSGTEFTLPYTKIVTGSYTGTGTFGSDSPNSLTFDGVPALLLVADTTAYYLSIFECFASTSTYSGMERQFSSSTVAKRNSAKLIDTTFSWYGTNADLQLNVNGTTYNYAAFLI